MSVSLEMIKAAIEQFGEPDSISLTGMDGTNPEIALYWNLPADSPRFAIPITGTLDARTPTTQPASRDNEAIEILRKTDPEAAAVAAGELANLIAQGEVKDPVEDDDIEDNPTAEEELLALGVEGFETRGSPNAQNGEFCVWGDYDVKWTNAPGAAGGYMPSLSGTPLVDKPYSMGTPSFGRACLCCKRHAAGDRDYTELGEPGTGPRR